MSVDGRQITRSSNPDVDCCRHFFTINAKECTNPGPIEGIHQMSRIETNVHRPILGILLQYSLFDAFLVFSNKLSFTLTENMLNVFKHLVYNRHQ